MLIFALLRPDLCAASLLCGEFCELLMGFPLTHVEQKQTSGTLELRHSSLVVGKLIFESLKLKQSWDLRT